MTGHSNTTPGPAIGGRVSLLSWVSAGKLCEAGAAYSVEDAEEWMPCPVGWKPEIFALRVVGDSMDDGGERGYRDGEIIFADPTLSANHNDDVIACTSDGRATFKRLQVTPEGQYLAALNPHHPERKIHVPEGTRICAVVVFSGKKRRG